MTSSTEKPLTGNVPLDGSALDLPAYEKVGGYQAIRKVMSSGMTPKAIIADVKNASLRGRGGAGVIMIYPVLLCVPCVKSSCLCRCCERARLPGAP